MFYYQAFPVLLCAFAQLTSAVVLSSSPTANTDSSLTTPPPSLALAHELRKREADYSCGTNDDYGSITCIRNTQVCKGTILANSHAYQYCSTSGVPNQEVHTKGIGDYTGTSCGFSTLCCGEPTPALRTILYVASTGSTTYTVTGFVCGPSSAVPAASTITFNAYSNVLEPSQFRISLARLASSTSTSSSPVSSISAGPKPLPNNHSSGSGLSSGTKIGIGVGVGAGVGIVLIAALAFFCWRRHNKKKEERRIAEVTPSYAPYSPDPSAGKSPTAPYSPPMSYNQSQAQYYQPEHVSQQWTSQSPTSAGFQTADYAPRELHGETYQPKT